MGLLALTCPSYLNSSEETSGGDPMVPPRVVCDDDQQARIAGRELLEGCPLMFRSLASATFQLTREHVMSVASERPSVRILARDISVQRPRRHGEGQEC
jgi:hypothetical protein